MKFYNIISRRSSFLFVFFVFLFHSSSRAQTTSSPYSRYGIGDIQTSGFAQNFGMGGVVYGLNQPYNINSSNPASYSSLLLTTFEAAASANLYEIKSSTNSGKLDDEAFGYFAFGIPIKYKKIGMSFGLHRYSNVGYSITDEQTNQDDDIMLFKYDGSGGLNQFYLGFGWSPYKDLSIGMNGSFMFGTINQTRRIEYPYDNSYYNAKVGQSIITNDFYFNVGIIKTFDSLVVAKSDSIVMLDKGRKKIEDSLKVMNKKSENAIAETSLLNAELIKIDSLKKRVLVRKQKSGWSFNIGASVAPSQGLKGKLTLIENSYVYDNFKNEITKDTVRFTVNKSGNLVIPLSVGTGISFKKGTRWLIGTDFSFQNWQDYSLFGEKDSLSNSWRMSGGLQWVPNDRSNKSYFNAIQYRLGFHYEQTYLQIHNTQLNDFGVSAGFGLPMRRAATTIQITVEGGRRGTTSNNLIELNYLKLTFGATLNDRWFVKSKFD